ncbi:sigma-70 family RNA polymerase sigma factor [Micromonospora inyonensis]|uniref:RNA polymerase sigma factor, sigma-70 family n=1 Tax=Micromonospora inyonensis TaxID=47866 RepID=A0A1C6S0T8_9ACTN|nr:sigma-70 family RNA polymerase sigma factor [Micromonospora inyonensis]SCL23061.1 RNA polymerase sigma factor, sigma-70 family [Micromonospora inyonensis]
MEDLDAVTPADTDSFDEFVRTRSPALLRSAYLLTTDRHAAEDLLQEVLERLYARWRRARQAPDAYARRILVNRAIDRWRWRGRRREAALADVAGPVVGDHAEEVTVRQAVLTALRSLPPRQRAAVVLRYLDGALAVVLLAGGLSAAGHANRPPRVTTLAATIGERLLAGPTRGDLATHADYLRAVTELHERTRYDAPLRGLMNAREPAGPAHVTWAGTTQSGRAAVVAQRMRLVEGDGAVLVTFVGTGVDGRPEKVGADVYGSGGRTGWQSVAFLTGPERSTLVVPDVGIEVEYSVARRYTADAVTRDDWQPVPPPVDGAALITIGPQRDRWTVAVRQRAGAYLGIGNLTDPTGTAPERGWLGWRRPADADHPAARPAYLVLGGSGRTDDLPDVTEGRRALAETPVGDVEPQAPPWLGMDWIAVGRTPSGEEIVAGDLRMGSDPVRTLVRLHRPGEASLAVVGPVVDPAAYLPVVVRLPDGRGWLVAQPGAALSWSDGRGDWRQAGRDAALLPAGATQVRVGTVTVRLG